MRQNNKMDMTVTEQIFAIHRAMCANYCKYNELYEKKKNKDTKEIMLTMCAHCPIREL